MSGAGPLLFAASYLPFLLAYVAYLVSGGVSYRNLRHRTPLRVSLLVGFLALYYVALPTVQDGLAWLLVQAGG